MLESLYFWIVGLGRDGVHNPVFCCFRFAGKKELFLANQVSHFVYFRAVPAKLGPYRPNSRVTTLTDTKEH